MSTQGWKQALATRLAGKALSGILTVWAVATLVFLAIHLLPGDPVSAILGEDAPLDARIELRARLFLDRPLHEQYGRFLGGLASGEMGTSFSRPGRSVGSLLSEAFPHTVALALASMIVALGLGIPAGVGGAVTRGRAVSRILGAGSLVGLAIPNIWLGPVLIVVFSIWLGVTPLPGEDTGGIASLILPSITLGTALMAILSRLTRSGMEGALAAPYMRTASAKGVGRGRAVIAHALPNALLPVVSVGGLQLGALLTGTVITEKIFERPGLGSLFLEAYYSRDIPVVMGCVLLMATIYVVVNALTDSLYLVLDPRLRRGHGGGA